MIEKTKKNHQVGERKESAWSETILRFSMESSAWNFNAEETFELKLEGPRKHSRLPGQAVARPGEKIAGPGGTAQSLAQL